MAKIIAPNKQYSGISATVEFVNGVGETANPNLISWFKSKGYEVIEDAAELIPELIAETVNHIIKINEEPVKEEPEKEPEVDLISEDEKTAENTPVEPDETLHETEPEEDEVKEVEIIVEGEVDVDSVVEKLVDNVKGSKKKKSRM